MRRQRHASPSPAQATAHSTEEDGHAKGAKQAGTNSSTRSNVWRSDQSPPLIVCESHPWTYRPPTTATLSELRFQRSSAPLRTLVFLSSITSYSQVSAFHWCTAVLLHPELMLVKKSKVSIVGLIATHPLVWKIPSLETRLLVKEQ